ncbi:hypothetical protein HFP57_12810 [Parasphingopyxis algicola]|uniref:hypothetical protein n=1 Tax=Parasphingopyxis algicola TaxID=2026624 RepID=UPI0015A03035|nr:hypothetical protein [Parasphingopyxis algicola]QLC25813.1 hypothetical protein HFP57_12810 [Parasphingopyxis algicola]
MRIPPVAIGTAIGAAALIAAPAVAGDRGHRASENLLDAPIAGVENDYWYDYLADVFEAEQELQSDLARATDPEDRNDAWAEYYNELADARDDYAGEMAERGYRVGRVTLGNGDR